jgi:hypothetical protein
MFRRLKQNLSVVKKSKGRQPRTQGDTAAEIHADARLNSGFTIDLLASEYQALHASVLKLWLTENKFSCKNAAEDQLHAALQREDSV